ncbi:MAG: hypothetical protein A4E23_00433 [Methanomethylovorans sp. PtaU1.Bin073]|nr:MAG: hypothetical protein A4E23_00433 [Methanomethylovorans sp. PtaU1.Bin073]
MSIVDNILRDLDFKENEIELYTKIKMEVFLKLSNEDKKTLVSRIEKMIDQEYSE